MSALVPTSIARKAYEQFGIFKCSDALIRHGISSPAEQLATLVWFVQFDLAKADSVPVASEDHLNRRIQEQPGCST